MPRFTIHCAFGALFVLLLLAGDRSIATAHPMGNFAICHFARVTAGRDSIRVRYILDMAEIPTVAEKDRLDTNRDGKVSDSERAAYVRAKAPELLSGIVIIAGGKPIPLTVDSSDARLYSGAGGLQTLRIVLDLHAAAPPRLPYKIEFSDSNYAERTGWKEIVASADVGITIRDSTASTDDLSRELTSYPPDAPPPQQTSAHWTVAPSSGVAVGASYPPDISDRSNRFDRSDQSGKSAFTEAIARGELTPAMMVLGILAAFVAGAFHALSPGHGKAMVAAYLVGTRGTARHAAILGITVTITHTAGVFLLGFVTLVASQYIVPEKLYPWLSAISGLAVFGVGIWLLATRLRGVAGGDHHHHHDHEHGHEHTHEHEHMHPHDHIHEHSTTEHEHEHDHDHKYLHEHGIAHSHGHGHSHHHHVPEGPVTPRALLALGISGGIVPCPSALIVLLAAVHLHRIAYGMLLITAFSLGLASVLVAIGILVVYARHWLDRLPSGGPLMRRLPVASAAAVTLIGAILVLRSFNP